MSESRRPTQFGQIYRPDEAWLATQSAEAVLEPDLPIIDPHHHLWERPDHRYLLHEFLADVRTGHRRLGVPSQLADVIDVARSFPRASIIMGHVGAPLDYGPYAGKREEVFASWKAGVSELAKCDNVI
jgi:predicted TIM-barrel fold metal-dependent hydrolase